MTKEIGSGREQRKESEEIELPKSGVSISEFILNIRGALIEEKEIFYRPVERAIIKLEMIQLGEEEEKKKVLGFQILNPPKFVTHLEKTMKLGNWIFNNTIKINEFKRKSTTQEVSKIVLASDLLQQSLPMIEHIYNVPVPILKDGKLTFPKKGYDPKLNSWLVEDAPALHDDMKLDKAKEIINELFSEFCFKKEQDKTNAISALLTPYLRGLYSRPTVRNPIYFYTANRERAGKDYCAGITGIVHHGVVCDETPITDGKIVHDDEFRKKTLSKFRMGQTRFHIANNKGHLNSAQLEALSTNENFSDRILGSNTILTYPNDLELSLSANSGITYTPDLANRCVFINLFLDIEDPNERSFKNPDLHGSVKERRSDIISALYALIRDWFDKGMPPGQTPFASFPEWASVCGGILNNAGLGDPCIPNSETMSIGGDSETQEMKKLFELCHEAWGEDWVKISDIRSSLATEDFEELFAWADLTTKGGKMSFGKMFRRYVGRVLSGVRLIEKDNSNVVRRVYQFKKEVSTLYTLYTSSPTPIFKSSNVLYKQQEKGRQSRQCIQNTQPDGAKEEELGEDTPEKVDKVDNKASCAKDQYTLSHPAEIKKAINLGLDGSSTLDIARLASGLYAMGFSVSDVDKVIKKNIKEGDWFSPKPGLLARLS